MAQTVRQQQPDKKHKPQPANETSSENSLPFNHMHSTLTAVAWFTRSNLIWSAVIFALLLLTGGIVYLVRKKWPGALAALARHPFAKYVVLSVVAHLAIAIWLCFSQLFNVPDPGPGPQAVVVQLGDFDGQDRDNATPPVEQKPWDAPPVDAVKPPAPELPAKVVEADPVERPDMQPPQDFRNDVPVEAFSGADFNATLPETPVDQPAPERFLPADSVPPASVANALANRDDTADVTESPAKIPPPVETANSRSNDQGFAQSNEPTETKPAEVANEPLLDESDDREASVAATEIPKPFVPEPVLNTQSEPVSVPIPKPVATKLIETPEAAPAVTQRQVSATPVSVSSPDRTPQAQSIANRDATSDATLNPAASSRTNSSSQRHNRGAVPPIYRDRWASDRVAIARARGGSEDAERAVRAALQWLASAQSEDGRWDASRFGSGRPTNDGGHNRMGAGMHADAGITGLALLAFLGSGHTHLDGPYADNVRAGIDFLLATQRTRRDGAIVGNATSFAAMYCHGISTLAISEAWSLTGDERLEQPVKLAIRFTLRSQNPTTGGWRYEPGQLGDTSQLGWQLMALTSAHYANVAIPYETWTRAGLFLNSVARGSRGGLAAYRPGQPRPSTAMTAESLLCRLFLQTPVDHPLVREASGYLMNDLPGQGRVNYYYWYYGTLALYHLQDHNWQRWNSAVKRTLLRRQSNDGSWDANSVWGPSGGKVYTTSLAALTLEVYYRYRPLSEPRRRENTARNP